MAYMNQEKKAKIAAAIKPILAKYKLKGTLSVSNHMTIVLTIKSGSIDFIGNFNLTNASTPRFQGAEKSIQVNTYWYQEHFNGVAKAALSELVPAMKSADWYDRSDIQSDYFDTAYYVDVNVGKWDKPYEFIA
jgi:hypothetical protein